MKMLRLAVTTDSHWGVSKLGNKINQQSLINMGSEKPDVLLHAGDCTSHDPTQITEYWNVVRNTPGLESIPLYVSIGNHSLWSDPITSTMTTVEQMIEHIHDLWTNAGVKHLHGEVVELENNIFLGAFDSWYQDAQVSTNDWRMTAGLSGAKRMEQWEYLQKRSLKGFSEVVRSFNEIKANTPQAKTIMLTHMGFLESQRKGDWKGGGKNDEYFGAPVSYEYALDSTDQLIFGHSHRFFDGLARNGTTKCLNVGSDYEDVRYQIIEV
jgi:predicted phosphodiesterase